MGDPEATAVRTAPLGEIQVLPARYAELVSGIIQSQRQLAWSAVGSSSPSYFLLRNTEVKTKVFLSSKERGVVFFFRRPAEEEVVLDVNIGFSVRPALRPAASSRGPLRTVTAHRPPFFGGDIPAAKKRLLASALGEKGLNRIAFVQLGLFYLAVTNPDRIETARAAFMWHGDDKARVVLQRVLPATPLKIRYEPMPLLMLLDEVAAWAKSGFSTGRTAALALNPDSIEAVPRILNAVVAAWESGRQLLAQRPVNDPLSELVPDFQITSYRADVTLRLKPDGRLAEKRRDDTFRLSMAVKSEGEDLRVTVGAPDFLVEGELYQLLLDQLRDENATAQLFRQSRLDKTREGAFRDFLRASPPVIFRASKEDGVDTEVFVFRGDWDGQPKALAASLRVRVSRQGESIVVKANPNEAQVVFHNLGEIRPEPKIEFPQFLLALVHQLRNWEEAFE